MIDRLEIPIRRQSLSAKQVQQILGISQPTFYHIIRTGQLKAIKVGRAYRVFPDDLDAFIIAKKREMAEKVNRIKQRQTSRK